MSEDVQLVGFGLAQQPTIEQEIQAKGLTAPRVTMDAIEKEITSEHYFTAYDGVYGQHKRMQAIPPDAPDCAPLLLLTICVLVLRNGFAVTGESTGAMPMSVNAELECKRMARQNAINKMWPLLGYELKSRLNRAQQDNLDLPATFVADAIKATDELSRGEATTYQRPPSTEVQS